MKRLILLLIYLVSITGLNGQIFTSKEEQLEWWKDARFGMFIHWGPVSIKGTEISWSRGGSGIPIEEYDALYKQFNPVNFNAEEWVKLAKDAGMKYIVFTSKHHDGFCMWNTQYTDFNIMNSPFKRDVMKELTDACKKYGMAMGFYHSTCDWHHPDFPLTSPGGRVRREISNIDRYTEYLKKQSVEIIKNYGPLLVMWYDVPQEFDSIRGQSVINYIRKIQPDILVNNRTGASGDFGTPEQEVGSFQNTRPWETCMTIGTQWAWKPNDEVKSLEECLHILIRSSGGDGNLLFNVGPKPDGTIEPLQAERLREMGKWLEKYGYTIYGTRGGPFKPTDWGVSTRKDNKIYLHILKWPGDSPKIVLPDLGMEIKKCVLADGGKVRYSKIKGDNIIEFDGKLLQPINTIVEIEVAGNAMDIKPVEVAEQSCINIAKALQKKMIWSGNDDGKPSYTVFRKTFSVSGFDAAMIHVFADVKYLLWINGKEILRGPCRFDPVSPSFDSMDITSFLNPGKNVAVIMVMSHGSNGKMMDHHPGLTTCLEIKNHSQIISRIWSDNSWKWNNHTRFLPPVQTWGFVCDRVDARLDDGDWNHTDYDDRYWASAVPIDGNKWGPLSSRAIPLLAETEMDWKSLNKKVLPVKLSEGQSYIIKANEMIQGFPVIHLDSMEKIFPYLEEGAVIQIELGYTGDSTSVTDTYGAACYYTARRGTQVYTPTDSYGFRYLKVKVLHGNIILKQIKLIDRRYPYLETGSFKCNDPFLNELWKRSALTLKLNCEDGYLDCALREKTEWMGDAALLLYPLSKKLFAIPDSLGVPRSDSRLMESMLRHIAQSQQPIHTFRLFSPSYLEPLLMNIAQGKSDSGMFKARHPNDFFDIHAYIEDYSCLWVQALREVYETTGNSGIVYELWEPLKKQMNWFMEHRSSNGLVYGREFTWFDNPLVYCRCNGATLNAFVFKAFRDAAFLASVTKDSKFGLDYAKVAEEIFKSYNKYLWIPSKKTYSSGIFEGKQMMPTSHSALMALNRGIVPENRTKQVQEYLFTHFEDTGEKYIKLTNSTDINSEGIIPELFFNLDLPVNGINGSYTSFWMISELFKCNKDIEALKFIREKWNIMMKDTLTGTLTEDFERGDKCHNSGTIPAYYLSSNVLGVSERLPAGSNNIDIKPMLGDLTRAEGTVVTSHGPVHVRWVNQADGLFFSIDIPRGTKALISLPYNKSFKKILVNGSNVSFRIDKNSLIFTTESNITDGIYK